MGILDEAIKEHLELKRQHGAGESELKQLEDEAFGAAERPGGGGSGLDPLAEAPTEFMSQPDRGEGQETEASAPKLDEAPGRRQPRAELADLQEAPPQQEEAPEPEAAEPEPEEPAEEPAPAMEHETLSGPSTEERHAIAEQPTEMFDVEEELAGSEIEIEQADSDEDDDFWDEKRLSDELDQALEAPIQKAEPEEEESKAAAQPEPEAAAEPDAPERRDEDVLEETPEFLEEAPKDDELWFEQKPPKDFDFDD